MIKVILESKNFGFCILCNHGSVTFINDAVFEQHLDEIHNIENVINEDFSVPIVVCFEYPDNRTFDENFVWWKITNLEYNIIIVDA